MEMREAAKPTVDMLGLCAANTSELAVEHDNMKIAVQYKQLSVKIRNIAAKLEQLTLEDDLARSTS
jgi:hypothetical protein